METFLSLMCKADLLDNRYAIYQRISYKTQESIFLCHDEKANRLVMIKENLDKSFITQKNELTILYQLKNKPGFV